MQWRRKTEGDLRNLFANVLQIILHRVLLIARVKVSRLCSTINFTQDYFRQQSPQNREQNRKVAAEEFHFRDADDLPSGSELLTKSDSELVFSVDMV